MLKRALWTGALALGIVVLSSIVFNVVANAATYHKERTFKQESGVWPHPDWYWLKSAVDWNVKTAGECHNLYPCFGTVRWTKDYGEGLYEFDHWHTTVNRSGSLANGTMWRSRTIGAQFEGCIVEAGLRVCARESAYIKIVIRTDGTSSVSVRTD
jgi:hypothetical protein